MNWHTIVLILATGPVFFAGQVVARRSAIPLESRLDELNHKVAGLSRTLARQSPRAPCAAALDSNALAQEVRRALSELRVDSCGVTTVAGAEPAAETPEPSLEMLAVRERAHAIIERARAARRWDAEQAAALRSVLLEGDGETMLEIRKELSRAINAQELSTDDAETFLF